MCVIGRQDHFEVVVRHKAKLPLDGGHVLVIDVVAGRFVDLVTAAVFARCAAREEQGVRQRYVDPAVDVDLIIVADGGRSLQRRLVVCLFADEIDEAARRMGWELAETPESAADDEAKDEEADEIFAGDWDPYTLHRNPVYISTRALYVSLLAHWERVAAQPDRVPAALGITLQALLYRGNEQALQGVQALEMGDYTLAVLLFKKALRELNLTLARLNEPDASATPLAVRYREYALPRLFDLREIWLRVMNECRQNLGGNPQAE